MSPGPGGHEGPGPVPPARARTLGELLAEQRKAAQAGDWEKAADLNRQIGLASRGTAASPLRETTGGRAHVTGGGLA